MKKITFNTLPEAISELINRVEKIEKLLSKKTPAAQSKAVPGTKKSRRQATPAGLLNVKEAGKFLNMSMVNLYSYVKNKKIPFEKQGRRVFFSKAELEKWKKSRNETSSLSGDNITIKDAVKLLHVPAASIYYIVKTRKIVPVAKSGNKLFFSKKELINAFSKPEKRQKRGAKPAQAAKAAKPAKATKVAKDTKAAKAAKPAKTAKAAKASKAARVGRPPKTAKTQQAAKAPKAPRKPRAPKAPVVTEAPEAPSPSVEINSENEAKQDSSNI